MQLALCLKFKIQLSFVHLVINLNFRKLRLSKMSSFLLCLPRHFSRTWMMKPSQSLRVIAPGAFQALVTVIAAKLESQVVGCFQRQTHKGGVDTGLLLPFVKGCPYPCLEFSRILALSQHCSRCGIHFADVDQNQFLHQNCLALLYSYRGYNMQSPSLFPTLSQPYN